ncbi:MAG: CRTAC1 family protein [Pirellula sp.]
MIPIRKSTPRKSIRLIALLGITLGCIVVSGSGCGRSSPNATLDRQSPQKSDETTEPDSTERFDFAEVLEALPASIFRDGNETGLFALLETTGGGNAIFDFDRDGQLDVLCSGGGYSDISAKRMLGHNGHLYRGLREFAFSDITKASCIDLSSHFNAAIIANDYDNDGFTDFLATGYDAIQWFHNQGDGTFEQVPLVDDSRWSSGAAMFDADGDGDLDLYVVHYADWSFDHNPFCPSHDDPKRRDYCGPTDFSGLSDSLYENRGDGTFIEQTQQCLEPISLRGLGILAADLDGDLDTDLYIANDVEQNLLYRNNNQSKTTARQPLDNSDNTDNSTEKAWTNAHWTEMGRRAGVACDDKGRPEGSMGVALGDFNLDGKFDLWVTNYQNELNALYRNNGNLSFAYASKAARIAATDELSVSWGTSFFDAELDGDEDLVVINGHLERYSNHYQQRPQLLENIDGKYFVLHASGSPYFQRVQSGRGLSVADFDRDGRQDLVVTRIGEPHALVQNRSKLQGRYLSVRLVGTTTNRDAIGATATLRVGERSWIRQVIGGGSYASTSDRALHFGIPERLASEQGELTIVWPSGEKSNHKILEWDREILVIEPDEYWTVR